MSRNPNVDLLEALLENFLGIPHLLPILGSIFDVQAHADQAVFIDRALLQPVSLDDNCIGAGCTQSRDKFVVRFDELLIFDCPAVIVEEGQQDFEPDHSRPLLHHR